MQKTEKIWHNGSFVAWEDAQIHVLSHVVHYGTSVFEGLRCYELPQGPAIFRAHEHVQRLLDSAKIYRMEVPYTREQIVQAMLDLIAANGVWPCYVRPIVLRGYGELGVIPFKCPVEVYIANFPWGKYLAEAEQGVDVCVSSWTRLAPNTLPARSKPRSMVMPKASRWMPKAMSARAPARTCFWCATGICTLRLWAIRSCRASLGTP